MHARRAAPVHPSDDSWGDFHPTEPDRPTALFLIHDLEPGGAERVYVEYLSRIRGFHAIPVLVRPTGRLLRSLTDDGPIYHLEAGGTRPQRASRFLHRPRRGGFSTRSRWAAGALSLVRKSHRLSRIARTTAAGVVSTFLHKSHLIALVAGLFFESNLRVVVNIHEDPLQHLERHFAPMRRRLMRAYYRWLLPRAARIVVVAAGIRNQLVDHFGVPRDSIAVIHNPIDVAGIRRRGSVSSFRTSRTKGERTLLVGVGRLVHTKGFDLLLRAVHRIRDRLQLDVHLAGDGPERGRLEKVVRRLDLEDIVTFTGYVDNPYPLVAEADALVVPSRSEAWPNVIGEALTLGTPVVAARCSSGVEEFLQDGRCGILVPPEDPGALAVAIERLVSDPALQARLSARGRSRAEGLDASSVARRYDRELGSVLRRRSMSAGDG